MRLHHDWELRDEPDTVFNMVTGERRRLAPIKPNGRKVWLCKNCKAEVIPSLAQHAAKTFRKPNKKRKIEGEECEARMIRRIHES